MQIRSTHYAQDKTYTYNGGSLLIKPGREYSHHSFEGFLAEFYNTSRSEKGTYRGMSNDEMTKNIETAKKQWEFHKSQKTHFNLKPKPQPNANSASNSPNISSNANSVFSHKQLQTQSRPASSPNNVTDLGLANLAATDELDDLYGNTPEDPSKRPKTLVKWDGKDSQEVVNYKPRLKAIAPERDAGVTLYKFHRNYGYPASIREFLAFMEANHLIVYKLPSNQNNNDFSQNPLLQQLKTDFIDKLPYTDEIDHHTLLFSTELGLANNST